MHQVENIHVRGFSPMASPRIVKSMLPSTEQSSRTVYEARLAIQRIVRHEDSRLLVVVGPCSIHDPEAALEYAKRLQALQSALHDQLLIVMRTYFEKPRTTVGWRGLINDPHIDGSFDMAEGLRLARELLLKINSMGLPTAMEMLDPISPQYIDDLVSLAAIGARTTESQTHRAMASGLSMPVGFKNSTDGGVQVAVNAALAMRNPHSFLGIDNDGVSCVVKTSGNPDGLVILRGSHARPNYDAESIAIATQQLRAAGLEPALLVDCSHANSNYDHTRQPLVWETVLRQHLENRDAVVGMMIESNLHEGKQAISSDRSQMRYGVSITDACVGWETTEAMLQTAHARLQNR